MIYSDKTIAALATPKGAGALAIIRVSGNDTFSIVEKCLKEKKRFIKASPSMIRLYTFIDSCNTIIDEITAIKYRAPKSYTGEDMVEIICHGNELIVENILSELINNGASYAGKGEFTRRAFLNNKTDLLKAESIHELITSKNSVSHDNALNSYMGLNKNKIDTLISEIQNIMIELESEIEFSEEDDILERDSLGEIKRKIDGFHDYIRNELEKRVLLKEVENGVNVSFIGPSNVGKSSILNLVLGYERSIVDDFHGTTRDFVSESRKINNLLVTFIDTAGYKDTDIAVEKVSLDKTTKVADDSNVVVYVTSADRPLESFEHNYIQKSNCLYLGIINKTDLSSGDDKVRYFLDRKIPYIKTVATEEQSRESILNFIYSEIQKTFAQIDENCIITNVRQENLFKYIDVKLQELPKLHMSQLELVSFSLGEILKSLEEFSGKIVTDTVLNTIFNQFCIGK